MNGLVDSQESLFAHMRKGAVIITPNNRLSQQLLCDYYQHEQTISLEKPLCLSYSAFLNLLYQKIQYQNPFHTYPLLLSPPQERYLWQIVLKNSDYSEQSLSLLDKVKDAWTRCQNWEISYDHPSFHCTEQTLQFQKWAKTFQNELQKRNVIASDQIVSYVYNNEGKLEFDSIIWACFDELTPLQKTFKKNLMAQGIPCYDYDIKPQKTHVVQYGAKDEQDEWMQIAHWLKDSILQGKKQLAVVVPDLESQYRPLMRFFQSHFSPKEINLSLGSALIDYPIIHHALAWLKLNKTITHPDARLLLQSPYLKGAIQENIKRAQFMEKHELMQEEVISFAALIQALKSYAPILATHLASINQYPAKASIKEWVHCFKTRLNTLGFPGDYSFNSETYQCFQRLMALFDDFLQLSLIDNLLSEEDALHAIQDLAKTTIFQPKSTPTTIQILGLLEASGCLFEGIWICGLTDNRFPQKVNLSPFIPIELQKQCNMPHALPERELQFAKQTLQRFQYASAYCVMSYPKFTGDIPNLPSPLIIHLPPFLNVNAKTNKRPSQLIPYEESYVIPLNENESWSGGTTVLANQAKCPFRGFAEHRLHVKRESLLSRGPDASERGQVLHQVMEKLWKKIQNQSTLLTLSYEVLNQWIDDAIKMALSPIVQRRIFSFSSLIQDIELERLKRLVLACLNFEKERPPFEVEALEKTFTFHLADLAFQIRIDRLDKDEHHGKWVIDYKTSIPPQKPWTEERPEAPQLLLYALVDGAINTLLFIELKKGKITLSGLSENEQSIKGIQSLKKDEVWETQMTRWQQILTLLAEEFKLGHCLPKPNRSSTCLSCEFQNLCRS